MTLANRSDKKSIQTWARVRDREYMSNDLVIGVIFGVSITLVALYLVLDPMGVRY